MNCPACGAPLNVGDIFCNNCGTAVPTTPPQQQQPYQQQPYQQQLYQQQLYQQQPYQQQPYQQQPYQQYSPFPGRKLGVASMVLGIVALLLTLLLSEYPDGSVIALLLVPLCVMSIIFGSIGKSVAKKANVGSGMANAGLICSIVGLAINAISMLILLAN